MTNLFRTLYETVCLLGRPQPPADTPLYRDLIFPSVGLYTCLLTLALMLVYYYGLNRPRYTGFDKRIHWLVFLLLAASAGALVAWAVAVQQGTQAHPYRQYFTLANFLVAAVLFTVFSLAGKGGSTHAWQQPMKWPRK